MSEERQEWLKTVKVGDVVWTYELHDNHEYCEHCASRYKKGLAYNLLPHAVCEIHIDRDGIVLYCSEKYDDRSYIECPIHDPYEDSDAAEAAAKAEIARRGQ